MFSSLKLKLLLGLYIFILVSIPVAAYLASQHQSIKSSASEKTNKTIAKQTPKPTNSAAKELLSASEGNLNPDSKANPSSSSDSSSPTIANNFGPTLSLKAALEGRTADQSTKLFVGILEGSLSSNPKFLLSFTLDLPKSGEYSNLSLAGLTSGNKYTAILKGSAQIATASAFTMAPAVTNLNGGQVINMLSGDLNEDNLINAADYNIAKAALNSTSSSANWNANADLNKDGVVNLFDLAIISKNLNQTGATGTWTSPIPKSATPSASLSTPPQGSPDIGGYWMWIPK